MGGPGAARHMLYEMEGVTEQIAREAFRLAGAKLSVKTTLRDPDGDVMKASEFDTKSVDELKQELTSLLREQFNLRMQSGTGQLSQAGPDSRRCAATSRASRPSERQSSRWSVMNEQAKAIRTITGRS